MSEANYLLERRLRHALAKLGYRLCKERTRNKIPGYMIIDNDTNFIVRGTNSGIPYDLDLEDVQDLVNEWVQDSIAE